MSSPARRLNAGRDHADYPSSDEFEPLTRQRLSDTLVHRIVGLIRSGDVREGDRLPSITEMARRFRVGAPTLREALLKLESMRLVEIRQGVGVYITGGR
ncbi:MAG TPA: GntR family transcriptional regulator [Gemmatimonadaceae bacterium]|nr:GntR family transcriptional regulator [Gemmatimonadaceae bacterium]